MRSHGRDGPTFHDGSQQSLRIFGDKPADGIYAPVEQGRAKGRAGANEYDMPVLCKGQQVREASIG